MSALGQYVHASWAGYKKSGTYESQAGNTKQFSNFKGEKVFKQHRQMVLSLAGQLKLQKHGLQHLEKQYNKYHAAMWKKLKTLIEKAKNGDQVEADIIKAILAQVNSSWTGITADQILASLKPGPGNTLKYDGSSLVDKEYSAAGLRPLTLAKNQKKFYIGPLWSKAQEIETRIANIEKRNETELSELREQLKAIQDALKDAAKVKQLDDSGQMKKISGVLSISDTVMSTIVNPINNLILNIGTIEQINRQLRYQIPEILGQVAANMAPEVAQDVVVSELQQELANFNRVGKTFTSKLEKVPDVFQGFDPSVLEDSIRINNKDTYGECIWEIDKLGEGRAGKVDISFIAGTSVSLKTTDLGKIDFSQRNDYGSMISLQSPTSLLLYLLGVENMRSTWGTHYINVLAQHEDESQHSDMKRLRQIAFETLKLHLLYSALTGAQQLRKGQQADVFAIYDTAATKEFPRIRLYDMGDIILSAARNKSHAVILTPELDSISSNLLNKKEPISDSAPSIRMASNRRISKLLVQLRNHVIKVSLSKNYLQSLYMVRNTKWS